MFNTEAIVIYITCYFIGSVPFAYLFVKLFSSKNITEEGSGNVGTLNAITVTKSKLVGVIVLLADLIKGIVPVYVMIFLLHVNFAVIMLGSAFLIFGHNYPVWLGFKGGRGLATGAGVFMILNYYVVIAWCIIWLIFFMIYKKVLVANFAATVVIPLYVVFINIFNLHVIAHKVSDFSGFYFILFSVIITFIILTRHTEVFKLFKTNN